MNGPEHYRKAEEHIRLADAAEDAGMCHAHLGYAQAHATLALAAATAMGAFYSDAVGDARAWDRVAGVPMPGGDDD